jgi:D-sedoheptulose 7-phosphate isomerase
VLRAAAKAKDRGLRLVALLGPSRSPLDELADVALHVDAGNPSVIQQGHITIGHALCGWVEAYLASRA